MERKQIKKMTYRGLGFPILFVDVPLVKVRGIWTPAIDYNKLQKEVLLVLCQKPFALTGNQVHFIRTYFEMKRESFGKHFGATQADVVNWEKTKNKSAKLSKADSLKLRCFILEKLQN